MLMKLTIQIMAGVAMAVLVIAVGNRLYTEAELHATTQAMAKMNADAARVNVVMQDRHGAEVVGQRAQAEALAQANLAAHKAAIRKN
jgi:hypothetical protein